MTLVPICLAGKESASTNQLVQKCGAIDNGGLDAIPNPRHLVRFSL
jgi:hypothetical protein